MCSILNFLCKYFLCLNLIICQVRKLFEEVLGILWFQVCYDKIFLFCWKNFKKHDYVLKLYISHLKIKLFEINCIIFKLIYLLKIDRDSHKTLCFIHLIVWTLFYHYLATTRTFWVITCFIVFYFFSRWLYFCIDLFF